MSGRRISSFLRIYFFIVAIVLAVAADEKCYRSDGTELDDSFQPCDKEQRMLFHQEGQSRHLSSERTLLRTGRESERASISERLYRRVVGQSGVSQFVLSW